MTLPNFLVIGGNKCGTTSLYHYLDAHPDVFMSPVKEPRYFVSDTGDRYATPASGRWSDVVATRDEYEALFDGAAGQRARGEASTLYLYVPTAPARISEVVPDARLVAVLRHPAERMWSSHRSFTRMGVEDLPFDDAITDSLAQQDGAGWRRRYVAMGFYARQLRGYLDHFPPGQLQVHLYDDLDDDAPAVVRRVFSFLGVDPEAPVDTERRYNTRAAVVEDGRAARAAAAAERMSPEQRSRLIDVYREDILDLQELIGRDLSAWLT